MDVLNNHEDFATFSAKYKEIIYKKIINYMPQGEPQHFNNEIIRTYIDRKGQYRRPIYLLAWTQLYGGHIEDALLPAAVQQISEDYFLMHDDLIDKNMLRRGKPALHKLFGEEIAIIAGDTVHMILWKMAIDATLSLNSKIGMTYFNKLYDIMMVTHQGQYYDINNSINGKRLLDFTEEEYFKSIHAKSAYYSVYGPMQCGAIIAGADKEEMEKIKEYGTLCGNAFQIKDDILDCISTEEVLGKSIGTDVRESTRTLILWHTVHNANLNTLKRIEEIYAKRDKSDDEVKFIIDKFKELGSIDYAEKRAAKLTEMALDAFERNTKNINNEYAKNIARSGIGHVTNRKK